MVALAQRGHELVLAADRAETMGGRQMVERSPPATPTSRPATRRAGTRARGRKWPASCAWVSTTSAFSSRATSRRRICGARPRTRAAPDRAPGRVAAWRAGWRRARADVASRRGGTRAAGLGRDAAVPPRTAAGRGPDHAAHRHRIAAARPFRGRAGRGRPHGAARRQLGPSVQQGAAARGARPRGGLEPGAAAGGAGAARLAAGPRRGHGRAVLRPLVRSRAVAQPAGLLRPRRFAIPPVLRALHGARRSSAARSASRRSWSRGCARCAPAATRGSRASAS